MAVRRYDRRRHRISRYIGTGRSRFGPGVRRSSRAWECCGEGVNWAWVFICYPLFKHDSPWHNLSHGNRGRLQFELRSQLERALIRYYAI